MKCIRDKRHHCTLLGEQIKPFYLWRKDDQNTCINCHYGEIKLVRIKKTDKNALIPENEEDSNREKRK